FDFRPPEIVIGGDIFHSLSRVNPFSDGRCRNALALNHGPAERDARVDDDRARVARRGSGQERIEPYWEFRLAPFDAFQVLLKQLLHRKLAGGGELDQLAIAFEKD